MRILQIVHGFPQESIAGTESYCEALTRSLLGHGHECLVLAGSERVAPEATLTTVDQNGVLVARYLRAAGRPRRWTDEYDPEAERLTRHLLALFRPDIIHIHHWHRLTNNLVAISADEGIPSVVTLHDVWTTCPRIHRVRRDDAFCADTPATAPCLHCVEREPWQGDQEIASTLALRREIIDHELRLATTIIIPSEAHREFLLTLLDLPKERLIVLSHGRISTDAGMDRRAGGSGFPNRSLQIGHWGHLMPLKGTHLILEAVRALRDPSAVQVHLVGPVVEQEYERRLRDLAQGISVQFHGAYRPNDLQAFDFDIAVFASIASESYSFALDEALCLGLPVLVSDRGALPERSGSAALTFRAGDAGDLARRIQAILDAPEVLDGMRRSIRVESLFSMESHVAMLEKTYEDAAQGDRSTRGSGTPYLKLIAHTQQQSWERAEQLQRLEVARVALGEEIKRLRVQVADIKELQTANTELQRTHAELQRSYTDFRGEVEQLQHQLELIQQSRSWRWTAPLRRTRSRLRFLAKESRDERLTVKHPEVRVQERSAAAIHGERGQGEEPASGSHSERPPSGMAFFTICSKNFLAYARTLHDSLGAHYPEAQFFVALCDRLDDSMDVAQVPFEIIEITHLAIPNVEEMAQRYNITEFNTAIKPFVFNYIFTKRGISTVVYLDPDILVVDRFTEMDQMLESGAEAILTPHILEPAEGAEMHDQRLLLYGVYNLGFLALRNTARVNEILEWWGRRLQYHCVIKLEEGLFVDQRWVDLFPAFIPATRILDHPGYNVAYWNLPQRRVVLRSGRWFVNDQPLRFVHFSGHMLDDHKQMSRHSGEVTLDNIGDLKLLVREYRDRVYANNHHFYRRLPYAFSWNGESGVNLHTPQPVAHPTHSGGEASAAEEAVAPVATQQVGSAGGVPAAGDLMAGDLFPLRWRHILALARVTSIVYHRYGGISSLVRAWYAFRRYGFDHCKQKAVTLYRSYREEPLTQSQHVMRAPGAEARQADDSRPRMLYFDWAVPRVDHDSGSVTTMCLLDIFLRLGYQITYLPGDLRYDPPYGDTLTEMGIECVYYPAVTSVKQYLEANARCFHLFVLCRGPVVGPWLKFIRSHAPNALLIFNTVDLHYVRERRQAELEGSTSAVAQAERTKAIELDLIRNTDLTIVLSSEELYTVRSEIPDAPLCVLPLIVREIPGRSKPFDERRDLIFIGGFRHNPNVDAVQYFVSEIFPLVRRRLPDVRFHIVGSHPTGEVKALAKAEGVFVHGFVQDLGPILDGIRVAVAPLRFGAGIKGKIGKYLSYGVPTVATSIAVEGMGLRDHHNILVADTPTGFAEAIQEAYTDSGLWEHLSDAGLTIVRDTFSTDAAVRRTAAAVKSLTNGIRPVDSTYEIESFTAYVAHRARMEAEYARRHAFEVSLLPTGDSELSTSGYCVMCGCETMFVTSFGDAQISSPEGRMLPNRRERMACVKCKQVNRVRAAIHLLHQVAPVLPDALIYLTEQVTPLYGWLKERYPLTQGSEYLGSTVEPGALVDGVRNEDITRLTFGSNSFDYVLTFDVLEHVPNYMRGVEEIYRVLKPGGVLFVTVPFARDSQQNVIRAALDDSGAIVHRLPPEYRGNPIDPEKGSLCFQYLGWEFLDQLRDAGFRKVRMVLYWSARYGYLGEGEQMLLIAEKPLESSCDFGPRSR